MLPLIYRLTHRTLGCNDVADDPKLLAQTLGHFGRLDQSSGLEIMFPRLLTPSKLRKMAAGLSLHRTFVRIMDGRRRSGRKETDAMQTLMEQGTDDILISTFIIGALFAGLVNSTFNAAWILCHCADQPAWYARVRAEVDAAVARHRRSADETAPEVLRRLPMAAWESEFPLVDVCLRETIRMIGRGASMRKNLSGKDIPIGDTGQVIPKDAYAICGMEDAHMDETLYKDPETWDPDRYLPGRDEDKKSPVAYLGWGAGLHPCLGMRFAKLEIIMTTAFFFAHYDFRRCDKQGADAADALPVVDRGGIGEKLPVRDIFLACTPRT
ncbi:hypothetical protein CDD83_4098 [Cordyceps sp. RAO-2017]|nr:hypothetical protein CDD83_4098 [Cordyceps sp. RAO-2017]